MDTLGLNQNQRLYKYTYNNRNWLTLFTRAGSPTVFLEQLEYNANGNIKRTLIGGSYNDLFSVTNDLSATYLYDKSNRLQAFWFRGHKHI